MARTYTTVGWQDGTVLQPAKVNIQGTEYNVEPQVVSGQTPINATNLRKMDNEIKTIVEQDIPSVLDVVLIAVTDTAPSECSTGDKYYNTSDNKIYEATATDTWDTNGEYPVEGISYIVFDTQSTYAYNGTTLVSVGGGSGSSDIVIIGDETEATEDTKLLVDTSGTTDTLKYKDNNTFTELQIKALDSMPVGTIVEFDGQASDIPVGWEEINSITDISSLITKTANVGTIYSLVAYKKGSRCYLNTIFDLNAVGNVFTLDNSLLPKYGEIATGTNYDTNSTSTCTARIIANSTNISVDVYGTKKDYAAMHIEWEV